MYDAGLLIARLFLGVPFIIWGVGKLRGKEAELVPGLRALGLPDPTFFAYMVGACELIGGIGIVLGYPVTTFGVLLGLWCLATGYDAHRANLTEFLKNAVMAGGYFALATVGGGGLSLFGGNPPGVLAYVP